MSGNTAPRVAEVGISAREFAQVGKAPLSLFCASTPILVASLRRCIEHHRDGAVSAERWIWGDSRKRRE